MVEYPTQPTDKYTELYQQSAIAAQAGNIAQTNAQTQYYIEEKDKSIADAQLEVEVTLTKLHHLIKQDRFIQVDEGKASWKPINNSKRVLTEEGVERIMQTMAFYINKENLLSNFDSDQINRIMLTFRLALNANFYMRYNTIFRQPNFEECKAFLELRLIERENIKKYAMDIVGKEYTADDVKKEVLNEIEDRVEHEIQKIREEKRKENLREWELIFEQLSQMVLATLNRAWKGEERGSLRRHTNISEIIGSNVQPKDQSHGNFFRWRG